MKTHALAILVMLSALACGKTDGTGSPDAGGAVDGGVDADTCSGFVDAATNVLVNGLQRARSLLDCDADTQCALVGVGVGAGCAFPCGESVATNEAGAALLAEANDAGAAICARYFADGCPPLVPPPCPPSAIFPFATCVSGSCWNFPPQAWVALDVTEGSRSWTLTSDGGVTGPDGGFGAMAGADFATVKSALLSTVVRAELTGITPPGVTLIHCTAAPSGSPDIQLSVHYPGQSGILGSDVTDCVFGGPPGNAIQQTAQIVTAY